MKSLWLENDATMTRNQYWVTLFEDYGIKGPHKFVCNANVIARSELLAEMSEADQICFVSSMTFSGIELVELGLKAFAHYGWKNKIVVSGLELLDKLQIGRIEDAEKMTQVFEDNKVCELYEGDIRRIQWSKESNRFEYTTVEFRHKSDK